MNELSLFSGAGGGLLGSVLLGWRTVGAVEIEEYPRAVLLQRQVDGILPRFPIWDDVKTFDGTQWRGRVDVISGGFPCQDISAAGKGAGITGERSGLWSEFARIISEVRPRFVFVENSPMLTSRGLGTVLGDLSEMGFNAVWGVLGAHHAGAPHKRDRIWILAYSNAYECAKRTDKPGTERQKTRGDKSGIGSETLGNPLGQGLEGHPGHESDGSEPGRYDSESYRSISPASIRWWDEDPAEGESEPKLGRMAPRRSNDVDQLKALGNMQVPGVAALAWQTLYARIG